MEVRLSNMNAAKGESPSVFHLLPPCPDGIPCIITAVADAVRTSLGPKGMDKMVRSQRNGY
jgi:hypothetical protein